MEWEVSEPMPRLAGMFDVWLDNGTVRRVRWCMGWLAFQDCRNPAQNILCDASRVKGWRVVDGEK